jgi:hypothetical protein
MTKVLIGDIAGPAGPTGPTGPAGGAPTLQILYLDNYSSDPTGVAYSDSAMAAAQTALGSSSGLILLGAGTYKFADAYTFGPQQGLRGVGAEYTTINWSGSGPFILATESSFDDSHRAGSFGGWNISGPYGSGGTAGIKWGNLQSLTLDDAWFFGLDGVAIEGYAPGDGGWAEEGQLTRIVISNCGATAGCLMQFDGTSFDYMAIDGVMIVDPNIDIVRITGGAQIQGGKISFRGNLAGGASNTGAIFAVERGNSSGVGYITNVSVDVSMECNDVTGDVGHYTVWMGSSDPTSQFLVHGVLHAASAGADSQGINNPSFLPLAIAGRTNHPSGIPMPSGDALSVVGGVVQNINGAASSALYESTFFSQFGNMGYFQLLSGDNTLVIDQLTVWGKDMVWAVQQPSSGSPGTITLPSGITWAAGVTPTLQTDNDAVDLIRVTWFGTMGIASLEGASSGGGGGSGTVTDVSVATANGFAGTVATDTTTPVITIKTGVTGLLKGNGTTVSAATSGTDYAPATTGSSILKASSGGFAAATSGTDYAPATTGSSLLKANGSGGFSSAVSATDYAPATTGSSILKASSGGFANATAGTDYVAPAGSGASLTGITASQVGAIALSLAAALGDTIAASASGAWAKLSGNTTATKKFYTQTGTGSVSAAPAWNTLASGDIPNNAANTTGTAANLTGGATLPAYLAPFVSALTDGSSIATNAALGNDFSVTIAGNRTMAAPSNPVDGQKILYAIKQDGTGSRTMTWTTGTGGFSFGAGSAPTLSTAAGDVDLVAFRYSSAAGAGTGRWCYMGAGLGY